MADEIRAHYEQLGQVASRFSSQAEAIQQMQQQVMSSFDTLEHDGWEGLGSDAFYKEMKELILPATARLLQALEDAGQTTQKVAQTVKEAEEKASSLFKN